MNIKRTLFALLFAVCVIASCKNDSNELVGVVNKPPEIKSINAEPAQIGINQSSTLSVNATDDNKDELTYLWTTNGGCFLQGSDRKYAMWKAPTELGRYECLVTVSDGAEQVQKSISVDVIDVPVLQVSHTVIDFSYDLLTQTFEIENSGNVELDWTVQTKSNWITITPANGTTTDESDKVTVTIDKTNLMAGEFIGVIGVKSNGGNRDILLSGSKFIKPEMVYVPAGEYTIGSDDGDEADGPVHTVSLEGFWIDKYEVTYLEYVEFLNDLFRKGELEVGDCLNGKGVKRDDKWLLSYYNVFFEPVGVDSPIDFEDLTFTVERGYENHPVQFVTWYGAQAFAEYHNKRLPTEAEWEVAARGRDAFIYPWGETDPNHYICNANDKIKAPTMVGSYSPSGDSPFGCCDMAGNVWEWCSSLFISYPYDASDGREDLSSTDYRCIRGGSFDAPYMAVKCSARSYNAPDFFHISYGFRCAK